jgi:hypothetical protein
MTSWRRGSIPDYYSMALAEGEGAGTAYEYYAKERRLKRLFGTLRFGASLLVAGLPERYGYSLDFLSVAARSGARVVVTDDRAERLEAMNQVIRSAPDVLQPQPPRIDCVKMPTVETIGDLQEGKFDLALSCEVIQRVPVAKRPRFLTALTRSAQNVAVFAPNGGNPEHARRSGLEAVGLEDLLYAARGAGRILSAGYVDMPPFPPGLARTKQQRGHVLTSPIQRYLLKGLETWCLLESLVPWPLRKKLCHIVYVLLKAEEHQNPAT